MANELSTKWTYPLTMVSQDKRVPLPGVLDGYAGELSGVDGSVQGGLRPFSGFKTVYELNFFANSNHNENSFVTDFFPVNFKIDFDSYGYGFVYRAQRQTSAASGSVTFADKASDGDKITTTSTDGTKKTYRAYSGSTHGYSTGSTGKADLRFEFLKAAAIGGSIQLISEDGYTRTYKGVDDGRATNGEYDPSDGTILFNVGGTERRLIADSQELTTTTGTGITTSTPDPLTSASGESGTTGTATTSTEGLTTTDTDTETLVGQTYQDSIQDSNFQVTSYSGGTGTDVPADERYLDTGDGYHPTAGRTTKALSTINIDSVASIDGKTVIFADDTKTHTITFDASRSKSTGGNIASTTITQIEKTAATLNGKTVILTDHENTSHTITFDNTINKLESAASATLTVANTTSLNGLSIIVEDAGDQTHTISLSTSVTQGNSTSTVAGISGASTTPEVMTSIKKSLELAIAAGLINMTVEQSAGSQLRLTMATKGTTGNGKVITGTAVSGAKVTVTTFSGGNSGSTHSKAGLADSDGTTLFALQSLSESIRLAYNANKIKVNSGEPSRTTASATFTFGDTEFDDQNKGTCTLVDAAGTSHTYSIRNDYAASTDDAAEANFTFHASDYNSVNDASITLVDTDGLTKTFVVKNDASAAAREAEAEIDLGDTKFDDVNFAEVTITDAVGTGKTYRIRNDYGATTSSKAVMTFTFDAAKFNTQNNATLNLVDAAGTGRAYKIKTDYSAVDSQQEFNAGASSDVAAANFVAIVNSANGHNGTLVATASGSTVQIIQNTAGATGNTTITPSFNPYWNSTTSADVPLQFVGGGSVEFNAGANAAAAAENLKIAINSSAGHNGTITATRSGNIVKMVMGTAGSAGNTPITTSHNYDFNDVTDTALPTSFVGGDYIEFNAGASANAAGDNFAIAVNASGLKIDATNTSGAIALVQEVSGSTGNTSITKSSWDSITQANAPSAFSRGGFAEFNAGASATTAATNFCIEVNKYQGSQIIASSVAGAVTLSQKTGGASGNTTITTDSDWNSCIEGGSMPSTFTTGERSTLRLSMDTAGTAGNSKAVTGTNISGGHASASAFSGGSLGSTNAIAGILGISDAGGVLNSLRNALNLAIGSDLINYHDLGQSYFDNKYFKILMKESGSEGEGKRITGTAVGTPATGTATISESATNLLLDGKTFIFPVNAHTITFDNSLSQTSSTSTKAGIKDQTTPQGLLESLHRSTELAIRAGLVVSTEPLGSLTMTVKSRDTGTAYNSQNFTGTAVSSGHITSGAFSGGVAGSNISATPFEGGQDISSNLVAASEAASNLKAAIDSKMGHNGKCSATIPFGDTEFNDRNFATIELTDTNGKAVQYRIRNDFGAAAEGTATAARAEYTANPLLIASYPNNATITLTDGNGKTVTYTAKTGTADATKNEFQVGVSTEKTNQNLTNAINHFYGHNGTITASFSGNTVVLLQAVTGSAGNTTITTSNIGFDIGTISQPPPKFHGGGSIEFNAGASATVAAANLVLAINGSHGHNGTIKATNVGGTVTVVQQVPGSPSAMERTITDFGFRMKRNMEGTATLPSAFVAAAVENYRFTVETFSTSTSGATSPEIVITQNSTGNAGHTKITNFNSFDAKLNVKSLASKFDGGNDIMFDVGNSATDSRDNFKTAVDGGSGHSSKFSTSASSSGSNRTMSMSQAVAGNAGNTDIDISVKPGTIAGPVISKVPFSGGSNREGDIFLDFYHSKCQAWSYGNLIKEGVSGTEKLDVVSTGRVVVVGIRGESPVTFYVTKPECEDSSSDVGTSDACPTTATNNPIGTNTVDCFYDYSIVIETTPGPGVAPDLQGPEVCQRYAGGGLGSPGNEQFFNAASVFTTEIPSNLEQCADGTIVLCESLIDEGFYPGSDPIPTGTFSNFPEPLFFRSDEDLLDQLLGGTDVVDSGFFTDSAVVITSDEDDQPDVVSSDLVQRVPEQGLSFSSAVYKAVLRSDNSPRATVSIGPGVYFPQPHGETSRKALRSPAWTEPSKSPVILTTDDEEGSYIETTNVFGETNKIVFKSDEYTRKYSGSATNTNRSATATWTWIESANEASEITLFAAGAASGITYRAVNDDGPHETGDLITEGVVAFRRGDSSGSVSDRVLNCALQFKAAVESTNGHGVTLLTVACDEGQVTVSQTTTGVSGETSISFSTSDNVSSFIEQCNPIPPAKFTGGVEKDVFAAYYPPNATDIINSLWSAFYGIVLSEDGEYETITETSQWGLYPVDSTISEEDPNNTRLDDRGGLEGGGANPTSGCTELAAATHVYPWTGSYKDEGSQEEPNELSDDYSILEFRSHYVGSIGNNISYSTNVAEWLFGEQNNSGTEADDQFPTDAFAKYGSSDSGQTSISFAAGAPTNGTILTLKNTYNQEFKFKFDTASITQDGSKDSSGNYIVGIKDQTDPSQVARAFYSVMFAEKRNTRIIPSVATRIFTSVDLTQLVPGGGPNTLTEKDGTPYTDEERALWAAQEGHLTITNSNTEVTLTGDTDKIFISNFSGGTSILIPTFANYDRVNEDTEMEGNQDYLFSITATAANGGFGGEGEGFYRGFSTPGCFLPIGNTGIAARARYQRLIGGNVTRKVDIKGRYGAKNTIFDCFHMPGRYHGRAVRSGSNFHRHPANYHPFNFLQDRRDDERLITKYSVSGITVQNVGNPHNAYGLESFGTTGRRPNLPAVLLDSGKTSFEDCFFKDNSASAIVAINNPRAGTTQKLDVRNCVFCNNRKFGFEFYGLREACSFGTDVPTSGLHYAWHISLRDNFCNQEGMEIQDQEMIREEADFNRFAVQCTGTEQQVLTSSFATDGNQVEGEFNMNDHVLHLGLIPGGVVYPGQSPIAQSLCLYDVETIPQGELVDQLAVIKGLVYIYNDSDIENFAIDVLMVKADEDGVFGPPKTVVQGVNLVLDDGPNSYENNWTTRAANSQGGRYRAFVDYGVGDPDIGADEFVVEVDFSSLGNNISNANAYQVAINIAPQFSTLQWQPGTYKVVLRIRPVGFPGVDAISNAKTEVATFTVQPNFCFYGIDESREQIKDRKKLEAGDYVFAYQLYDSKSGRRSALSKVLEVRASDFSALIGEDNQTSIPEAILEGATKHAILDLVYDSDKYDYAYIYRSVNTRNATGTFSAGVLSLDGLIKLDEYNIVGHQPETTTAFKRSAYVYKLGDLELIYQRTYTQGAAIFDERMPFGGELDWYDGTLLMSSINNTPVSSTDTTGTQVVESLGELRWSSMTERSPELFSPMDRFVPSIPANEIINLTRLGGSVIGFSKDRMYHIRKEGSGSYGYLRLLEMHEGFGTPGQNTADTVASTIYFLTTKGIKAVDAQGKLDDVRGFDYYITNEWAGSNFDNASVAFDPISSVLYVLNPDKEEAACMWFNTARTSLLKDMNFTQVKKGPWVSDLNDFDSSLVERAMFLQNVPTTATAADGVSGYKPRIVVHDYAYSKTIEASGSYNGQRRLTMMDGKGDTRLTLLANSTHPASKSKLKIDVSTDQVGDQWVGSYLYVLNSATGSLVGNKAKILEIVNAQNRTYTSTDGGDTYIIVEGTDFQGLAAGDRVGISPVYFRWIGHPTGMSSDSGQKFAGIDFHRTKHLEAAGASFIDVSGPPSTDSTNTDSKYRALAFSGSNLTPAEKVLIKDFSGALTKSVANGAATHWAAFGADTSSIAMQGLYGIEGPALTPGLEVFCPDLDFRLLSVLVTGKILSSDRTNRGTVE